MTETMRHHNFRCVSDRDRQIVAARGAYFAGQEGPSKPRKTVAAMFGVSESEVASAERRFERDAKGKELLKADPESLEGFYLCGELHGPTFNKLHYMNNQWNETPIVMERVGDVAQAGRAFFVAARLSPLMLAALDAFLDGQGVAWAINPRVIERPKAPKPNPQPAERPPSNVIEHILERVRDLERRVSRLEGYIEEARRNRLSGFVPAADDESDDGRPDNDLERDGNLICLPGVSLSDVRGDGRGDRP